MPAFAVENTEYLQEFNWPASSKGLFLSAFFWGYIVTQLPGGMLARKLGPKLMMAAVIVIPSLFTLAIPFVAHKSAAALVACRVMTGLAAGVCLMLLYVKLMVALQSLPSLLHT